MPNNYVNSMQTSEARRTKYKLLKLLNEPATLARIFRDFTWSTIGRKCEALGHTHSEISAMLDVAKEEIKRCRTQD